MLCVRQPGLSNISSDRCLFQGRGAATIKSARETKRGGFKGERHAILILPDGNPGSANWLGWGTHVPERLARGDPPRTAADGLAQAHDLRYMMAQTGKNIRRADNIMLDGFSKLLRKGGDHPANVLPAQAAIRGKIAAENIGVLRRDKFTGPLPRKHPAALQQAMQEKLGELEMQGYGELSPQDRLKLQVIKDNIAGSGPGISSALPPLKILVDSVVPGILKSVGITKAPKKKDVTKLLKGALRAASDAPGKMNAVSKALLHLVTHSFVQKKNIQASAAELLRHAKSEFGDKHSKVLAVLKQKLSEVASIVKRTGGGRFTDPKSMETADINFAGTGFWDSFKKGFISVIKPATKVFAVIAPVVGGPAGAVAGAAVGFAGSKL